MKTIYIIILAAIISSCGATKKAANTPSWVLTKPLSTDHYIGIGIAAKTKNINDYKQGAKQNALADMASEIKTNISTTSILSKFEMDERFSEQYTSKIKATNKEYLEGYQTIGEYEDKEKPGCTLARSLFIFLTM